MQLYGDRSLIFVPVIEKPNSTAVITKNPTDLILNGEFMKIPLIIGYTSNEALLFELIDCILRKNGANIPKGPPNPEDIIPIEFTKKISKPNFQMLCSEINKVYSVRDNTDKKCQVTYCPMNISILFIKLLFLDVVRSTFYRTVNSSS